MKNNNDDVFDLGKTEANAYLQDRKKGNDDGLLRPKLEESHDGTPRSLVLRFLPNLTKEGKIKSTAVEKHIHYADFKSNPDLQGYFDCLKNTDIGKACPLCDAFWALKKTKDPKDEEKAKLINRSTKYYAYVVVVEDKQKPENEGKIFIFTYGFKIFQKIKAMATARKPCTVEDLVYGANLVLQIEEIGGYYNYDASYFEAPEPATIGGKILEITRDGKISQSEKERVVEFLKSRTHDLEEWKAQDWTPDQREKADKIVSLLSGKSFVSESTNTSTKAQPNKPLTSAQIFSTDDNDDDDDETKKEEKIEKAVNEEKKSTKKPVKEEKANDMVEHKAEATDRAKKKASAFFDDTED